MELYIAIALFALPASITPGPNNVMIMTSGVNFGIRRSLPHLLGICLGFPAMVVIIGWGFSMVFERYPVVHETIRILGVLYLLYLAWLIAHAAEVSRGAGRGRPLRFWQAALFQWVNPKAWVMATSAVAAFTTRDEPMLPQVLLVAGIFMLVAFPSAGTWLSFGIALQRLLTRRTWLRAFNITMALLLVASISPVIIDLLQRHLL